MGSCKKKDQHFVDEAKAAGLKRRHIERDFIIALLEEFGPDDIRQIMQAVKRRAIDGDAAALKFLSLHILGNGRVPLSEVEHPSMIRRTR